MIINNLSLDFSTQTIFDDVTINIPDNEKIGIVGVNGSGKTTLFRLLMKQITPDKGKITITNNKRIDWLPQVIDEELTNTDKLVLDFLLEARPIEELNKKLEDLYNSLADLSIDQNKVFKEIDKVNNKLSYWEADKAESILLKICSGLDIEDLFDKKVIDLSGGEKSKVLFARVLYSNPEILLLDEPTNHLDPKSKEYITNYLKNYKGAVLIISHDIEFLNNIITKTIFVDKVSKKLYLYDGDYDKFTKIKDEHIQSLRNEYKKQEKEEKKLRSIVEKYRYSSGNRKKMAQDREKKLEKLLENKIELPDEYKKVKLDMEIEKTSTKIPLHVRDLWFRYDKNNKYLLRKLSFDITRGEKFLIVGENGVGKSTLLKLIMGQLTPDQGEIELTEKTDIAYYAQELELLDEEKSILDNLVDNNYSSKQVRNLLGRFLFKEDDVFKKVKVLSPGEKARVALAKISLQKANLLLLDEPTNHLDPDTQKVIGEFFKTYKGTMIVVSHNPEFVDYLGISRILTLPEGKIDYYDRRKIEYFYKLNTKKK